MKTRVWSVFTLILILLSGSAGITQEIALDDKIIARLGEILSERKLANAGIQTRGSGEIFSKYLNSVPLVISAAGTGSSAVIRTSLPDSTSLVVTNHHVITSQFTDKKGGPFVLLLFYEPQLASEPLDRIGSKVVDVRKTRRPGVKPFNSLCALQLSSVVTLRAILHSCSFTTYRKVLSKYRLVKSMQSNQGTMYSLSAIHLISYGA